MNWTNSPRCTNTDQDPGGAARCVYEDQLFENRVLSIVDAHPAAEPLFLFYAPHIVHGPLQVPTAQEAKFDFIDNDSRRKYHSMVNFMDTSIGKLVDALKAKGMYNDTLLVFSSDNGGPLPSGNNYPRKGGKFSDWEGGIRVAAFASGGYLPTAVRGTMSEGLAAGWDWYATFCSLAGVDPHDKRAEAAGLPPIDGHDLWPLISGENTTSPRTRVVVGSNAGGDFSGRTSGATRVGAIVTPQWKIIVGDGPGGELDFACHPGPTSPNNTDKHWDPRSYTQTCGNTTATGCLFDVSADPNEHDNRAAAEPEVFARLLAELRAAEETVYSPNRGVDDGSACKKALDDRSNGGYGGYWGPFLHLDD